VTHRKHRGRGQEALGVRKADRIEDKKTARENLIEGHVGVVCIYLYWYF
jgi:hypothetical protein